MKVSKHKEKQMERMVQFMVAHFGDIFSEWNTKKANQFFALSGISQRNWSILMRHEGFADGEKWTLRKLAEKEGVSHIRVWQLVRSTRNNLTKVYKAMLKGDEESKSE